MWTVFMLLWLETDQHDIETSGFVKGKNKIAKRLLAM